MLSETISHRFTMMLFGLFSSIGLIAGSFATSLPVLLISVLCNGKFIFVYRKSCLFVSKIMTVFVSGNFTIYYAIRYQLFLLFKGLIDIKKKKKNQTNKQINKQTNKQTTPPKKKHLCNLSLPEWLWFLFCYCVIWEKTHVIPLW